MKRNNIKFIATLICLVIAAFAIVPGSIAENAYAADGTISISLDGEAVSELTMTQYEKVTLTAASEVTEDFQWQYLADEKTELWVNIYGETDADCVLSYAKVFNMLDEENTAQVRCVSGDIISDPVTFTVAEENAAEKAAPATFKLARNTSAYAAAPTAEGDESEEEEYKTYDITIEYILEKDNSSVGQPYIANVGAGLPFNATVTSPEVQGYDPYMIVGEKYVSAKEVTLSYDSVDKDETIKVLYRPALVKYTVIYLLQDLNSDDYVEEESEKKEGYTGTKIDPIEKEYEGFFRLGYEDITIAADGSTKVNVFYDRNYYLMMFDLDGGYGVEPIYAAYETPISVGTPTKAGYTFAGWTLDGKDVELPKTMPVMAENSSPYKAKWKANDTAKVTIVFWGENADDEEYSYLKSTEVNVKPGTSFTYSEDGALICALEEHTHVDNCVSCGIIAHNHSELGGSCYTLTCTQLSHTHSKECYADVGNESSTGSLGKPGNPVQGQVYEGRLASYIFINGTWYVYTGDTNSGNIAPTTCGKVESNHTHVTTCYELTCDQPTHSHSDSCYSCGKQEHTHNDDCYMGKSGLDSALWTFVKSDTVTVAADGSTVVNVKYDRTSFTLKFNDGNTTVKTITDKWGADIHDDFPITNSDGYTILWDVPDNCVSFEEGTYLASINRMPAENIIFEKRQAVNAATIYYCVEALPGEESAYTNTYNGVTKNFTLYKSVKYTKSGYLTYAEEFHDILGFTQWDSDPEFTSFDKDGRTQTIKDNNYLYYTRNSFAIEYYNPTELIKTESSVLYGADLTNYNYTPSADDAPSKYEPGSVKFEGWYLNPECTGEKFDFTTHKMPAGPTNTNGEVALSLYAKWVPVEHKVEIYKDSTLSEQINETETVKHGEYVKNVPEVPDNGGYKFVYWFYMDNGVEKAFDFENMPVKQDLQIYAKWSSKDLRPYIVRYETAEGESIGETTVEVADVTEGSSMVGTTKTFYAKGGTDLYEGYREGYFPTTKSHSFTISVDEKNAYTFIYEKAESVPYTVRYLIKKEDGSTIPAIKNDDGSEYVKSVDNNVKAIVTETYRAVPGYMPDAYQKRLVVSIGDDAENELIFYYTEDQENAYWNVTHYTENIDSTNSDDSKNYSKYGSAAAVGKIGSEYTAPPLTIPGFKLNKNVPGTLENGVLTANGLELKLYYSRISYPYEVRYLKQSVAEGENPELAKPDTNTAKYGSQVKVDKKDFFGYECVSASTQSLTIQIEESETTAKKNIVTFLYREETATFNYVAVTPDGGKVTEGTEKIAKLTGTAHGSTAIAKDNYKFVGWFTDPECTNRVTENIATVDKDNKLIPSKSVNEDGTPYYEGKTFYAKFELAVADLTITKALPEGTTPDPNQAFVFEVKEGDDLVQTVVIYGKGSVTIKGLQIGTYTVTEKTDWSWRYNLQSITGGLPIEGDPSVTITLTGDNDTVTFTNSLDPAGSWLGSESYAKNIFTKTGNGVKVENVANPAGNN